MNNGRLSTRITLYEYRDVEDGRGGRRREYVEYGDVWADVRPPSTRDVIATGTPASELMRQIIIRRHSKVARGWRVKLKGDTQEVVHVYDLDRECTSLLVKELQR